MSTIPTHKLARRRRRFHSEGFNATPWPVARGWTCPKAGRRWAKASTRSAAPMGSQRRMNSGVSVVSTTSGQGAKSQGAKTLFVPVSLLPPVPPIHVPHVRVELRRRPMAITVT